MPSRRRALCFGSQRPDVGGRSNLSVTREIKRDFVRIESPLWARPAIPEFDLARSPTLLYVCTRATALVHPLGRIGVEV